MISTYPKEMRHPNYRPAVISGYRRNADGSVANDPPGSPPSNPPVWVNNYDQELYYASLGYLPVGVVDASAYFATVGDAAKHKEYSHVDYPKWLYRFEGRLQSQIVNDPDEHSALGDGWFETPDGARESAERVFLEQALKIPGAVEPVADVQTSTAEVVQPAEAAQPVRTKRKYTRKAA